MAFADCGWFFRFRVQRHLHSCQECRTRQAAIEAAGHFWSKTRRPPEMSSCSVESARARFLERVGAEARVPEGPPVSGAWTRGFRLAAVAAALSCVLVAGINVWKAHESRRPPVARSVSPPVPAIRPVPAKPPQPVRVASIAPVPSPVPAPILQPVAETVDSRETAVELLWAIHQAGLCHSGSVDVEIGPSGEVAVLGGVDTTDQVSAIKDLLADVHGPYTFQVRAADSIEEAPTLPATEDSPAIAAPAPLQPALGDTLIESWLKSQSVDPDRVHVESLRISNQLVNLANEAWAESWAVRRLLERFEQQDKNALTVTGRSRLAEMTEAHLQALQNLVDQERQALDPILGVDSRSGPAAAEAGLADVAHLSELIQDTFASSSQTPPPLPGRIAELRSLVTNVSRHLQAR